MRAVGTQIIFQRLVVTNIDKETLEIKLALDAASSEWYKNGVYTLPKRGTQYTGQELAAYFKSLKEKYGLVFEESEYLVSDNENYASCIDKVYRVSDDTFCLGDIKTTYKLNKEYVQWQLSIYAHLFEKQNKGAKVSSIFAIWLRGTTHQLVELERVPDEKVEKLLYCDSHGLQYIENLPVVTSEAEKLIIDIESQLTGYSSGGCITYVELPSSAKNNIEALETIINYAMEKDIPYAAINLPIDFCCGCGYEDEIAGDECPKCGGTHIKRLRRVTGYLTGDYKTAFNKGKQDEVKDRVKHC